VCLCAHGLNEFIGQGIEKMMEFATLALLKIKFPLLFLPMFSLFNHALFAPLT